MTHPKSPGKPEPDSEAIRQTVDEILALSREILNQSTHPRIPQFNQLILKRGHLMAELEAANLSGLDDVLRKQCLEKLEACRRMDDTIGQNLAAIKSDLAEHLKGCREAHALLDKYKVSLGQSGTIRSEEA